WPTTTAASTKQNRPSSRTQHKTLAQENIHKKRDTRLLLSELSGLIGVMNPLVRHSDRRICVGAQTVDRAPSVRPITTTTVSALTSGFGVDAGGGGDSHDHISWGHRGTIWRCNNTTQHIH